MFQQITFLRILYPRDYLSPVNNIKKSQAFLIKLSHLYAQGIMQSESIIINVL